MATTCLHWSQPSVPRSPSSPQTLASAITSPSSKRRSLCSSSSGAQALCRYVHCLDRSSFFGTPYSKLRRTASWEYPGNRTHVIERACSARLDAFSDEEFSKKIQELASRFQLSNDEEANLGSNSTREEGQDADETSNSRISSCGDSKSLEKRRSFDPVEPPDWDNEIIPANIERKANSIDLPFSLRIIKRKKQWENGFTEAGESAYCSVKKAFSSMVFIIRELQSYTLQMREMLFYEDLQGILARVQKEMHMSFVWLFQRVFSHTPTLMVYVMILLANYSVYSMANNSAIASSPPPPTRPYAAAAESIYSVDDQSRGKQKFDSSVIKTFSVSSSSGKSASIGGSSGGGGKCRPVASGTEGDGSFDRVSSDYHRTVVPDGVSSVGNPSVSGEEEESVSGQVSREEEMRLWNSIVDEASNMQGAGRDDSLDHETMMRFVSPINANMEADDYSDYVRTELIYRLGLSLEPDSCILLANYAQFLYLVVRDFDRAEEYFKRAVKVEPKDAEALDKYANFLWKARNDLWGAEETHLEAIAVDPSNTYYAANYAHFLWSTGGEDTCYPLDA